MISIQFFSFLLVGVIIYWLLPKQSLRVIWLSLISLIYLYQLDKIAPVVVLLMTLFSYFIAAGIEKSENRKDIWHKSGVVCIILILVLFKYLGFLNSLFTYFISDFPRFHFDKLLLPLGLSYITFKHISFLTDIYWGINKKGKFIDFLAYSSLFTIFIAGPIERYERFLPQVNSEPGKFKSSLLEEGVERIIYGIFKKAVIADWIGYFIKDIWQKNNQNNIYLEGLALLGFSVQIYMDFSGYSDIAIGASKLFGLKIMENFNYPYFQQNISQFWRSWHISLSDWIRDYLFFPLSKMSTKKVWTIFFVPVLAMAVCGFWHGAAWHFMFWGMWHGIGLSILQVWNQYKKKNKNIAKISRTNWFNYSSIVVTFVFVTIGWWWFR